MAVEDHGALGFSSSTAEGKRGVTGGILGGSGQSVKGLGLSEGEGGTSFVKDSEDARSMERLQDGLVPERSCRVSGAIAGGLGLSVEKPSLSYSTVKRGNEAKRSVSGMGRIGVMESGLSSEPNRLQTYQSKDAKAKGCKRVSNSGEGTSSTEELPGPSVERALGQNMEGISPELAQIKTLVTHRSGSVG